MRFAAKWYYSQWRNNQNSAMAFEWLKTNYYISMDTITRLGLGFHDKEFHFFEQTISSFGMNEEAERLSLIAKSPKGYYYDKMRNSIIIPTISEEGEVVSFDYYLLNERQLFHYPNSRSFQRKEHLYSLNLAVKTKMNHVFIVASFEDYLLLVSRGIWNVV